MAPQMPRPAPRAITKVWRTPTAELKNSIFVLPESLGVGCVEISRIQQEPERKLRCSPDSGFSFQYFVHGFVPTLQARRRLLSSVSI